MQITLTRLPEVLEITPRRFGDAHGFFSENWNRDTWAAAGIDLNFGHGLTELLQAAKLFSRYAYGAYLLGLLK